MRARYYLGKRHLFVVAGSMRAKVIGYDEGGIRLVQSEPITRRMVEVMDDGNEDKVMLPDGRILEDDPQMYLVIPLRRMIAALEKDIGLICDPLSWQDSKGMQRSELHLVIPSSIFTM